MKAEIILTVEERQQVFPSSVGRLEELIGFRKLVRSQRSGLRREFCLSDMYSKSPASRLLYSPLPFVTRRK